MNIKKWKHWAVLMSHLFIYLFIKYYVVYTAVCQLTQMLHLHHYLSFILKLKRLLTEINIQNSKINTALNKPHNGLITDYNK